MKKKINSFDKIFPNQKFNKKLLRKNKKLEKEIDKLDKILSKGNKAFKIKHNRHFSIEEMGTIPIILNFYKLIIELKKVKNILEIGSFIANSAINFSTSILPGGKIVTIEKYFEFYKTAKFNIEKNKLSNVINLIHGDALSIIPKLKKKKFDMIFLDGNKEAYQKYLVILKEYLKKDGLLIIDDIFFHGDVFNSKPRTKKGQGVKKCLKYVKNNSNVWRVTLLPISNGILILRKK